MPADIFMSAGEASGDLQAALLLAEIRRLRPETTCQAIGSQRLRAAGAQIAVDSAEWASIGPVSALTKIPQLYLIMRRFDAALRAHPPRLVLPIDFGAFNMRLILRMRRCGYRGDIVYYFPPGAWLDVEAQARAVTSAATPLSPFTRQRDFYRGLGLPCEFFGHPLVSAIAPRSGRATEWPAAAGVAAPEAARIIIFPGSRREEVALLLPALATAAHELAEAGGAAFAIAGSSDSRARQIRELWQRVTGRPAPPVVSGDAVATASLAADLAWVASGTAVLETALRAVPQIAFYAVTATQYRIALRRVPQFVRGPLTLPNLIVGRSVIPELLQADLTPRNLVEQTRHLLADAGARAAQLRGYEELRAALGPPDALTQIARFVVARLDGSAA